MICYRDKTFCSRSDCIKFASCERALTDDVKKNAYKWWGCSAAPICEGIFECYVSHKND